VREAWGAQEDDTRLPEIRPGSRGGRSSPATNLRNTAPAAGMAFRNSTSNTAIAANMRADAAIRNLRCEMLSLRNRAGIEIQARDAEIQGLRKLAGEQRETVAKLRTQMKEKDRALMVRCCHGKLWCFTLMHYRTACALLCFLIPR
jgi:hypothetical protein